MRQAELFHDDVFDALRTDIQALGGAKKVGALLWPKLSPDKAGEKLSSCLNRQRAEKLDPEDILFIQREAARVGSVASLTYIADYVSIHRPVIIEPDDEKAQLQKDYIAATRAIAQIAQRLERLAT
jgi:hypothetical protein